MSTPTECTNGSVSQSACGFVLEFTDILAKYAMSASNTSVGGWPASNLYKLVNGTDETLYSAYVANSSATSSVKSIYMSLPEDLRDVIINTTVISGHGSGNSTNFTSADKLYLLDAKEIWGTSITGHEFSKYNTAKGFERQLDYYLNQKVTVSNYSLLIKKYNGTATAWWLRSPDSTRSDYFDPVNSGGGWGNGFANSIWGVSVAFRIG